MQSRKLLRRNLIKYSLASALTFASVCASAGPWNEHTLKVSGLATQMKGHENEIKELIERRKRARDPEDIKSIMEAIATQHKRYEEAAEKFNAEWLHMRFKHPEQAATL
jgi:hypothetical protein